MPAKLFIPTTTRRWPLLLGLGLAAALPAGYRLLAKPPRVARPARLAAGGWRPEFTTPGLKGTVGQVLPLANGNLLAVGRFTFADATGRLARNVARWDGANWQPLGANPALGAPSYVFAAAQAPGGDLLVAGRELADNKSTLVMRWNGTAWRRLGTPAETAAIWSLAVGRTGEVLAGRGPDGARVGLHSGGLARWDGQHWQPYATGAAGTQLGQWLLTAKGELVAAGYFPQGKGGLKFGVARWTGKAWQLLGPSFNDQVVTLAQAANGDLLAGGEFTDAGGNPAADHVARWDGTAWRSMGTGFDGHILRLLVGPKGEVVANGEFTKAGGEPARCLARWDGKAWHPLVARDQGYCKALLAIMPTGEVLGANNYGGLGPGGYYQDLVRYANQRWLSLASSRQAGLPSDEKLTALAASAQGELAVSGYFTLPNAEYSLHGVAYWNGTSWQHLDGLDGRLVTALLVRPGGEVIAGGMFPARERHPDPSSGDGPNKVRFVARWDGRAWQPLGAGLPGPVLALAQAPNGDVLASGFFGVARWDGKTWQPLGASPPPLAPDKSAEEAAVLLAAPGVVPALAITPKGDIFAVNNLPGKRYSAGSGKVMRWDGTAWQPLGPDLNGEVGSLAAAPNGDLLATGNFSETADGSRRACSVARWDGQRWQFLGPALPNTAGVVTVTDAGTVVLTSVSVQNRGSAPTASLARWDGAAWQPLGGGLNDYARLLVRVPGGGFAVAGGFTMTADSTQSLGHLGVYQEK